MNGMNDQQLNPERLSSPTHVTTIRSEEIHADTAEGAAWLRKYLHPPCSTPEGYAGIPDKNNSPSTDAEYKSIKQIQTINTNGPEPVYYNKILLIHTSSVIAPIIVCKYDTNGVFSILPSDLVLNPNINVQDMVAQNASGRLSYKSTTVDLNATAFNNQGVVTCAQFRPNISLYRVGDIISIARMMPNQLKAINIISQLCQFYGVIDSLESNSKVDFYSRAVSALGTAIDNFAQVLKVGVLPSESTQIAMMSPNSTSLVATKGTFLVQKFIQDSIPYRNFADAGLSGLGVSTAAGMPCFIFEQTGPTTGQLEPIPVVGQAGNPTTILADLPWFDFTWGYTLFEGLTIQTSAANPYLTIKSITGFEFQPLPNSMLSPFIRNSANFDFQALRFATMHNHARQDALPAAMNFWGSLGKVLLSAAPSIIDTITGIFGRKRTDKERAITNETVNRLQSKITSLEKSLAKTSILPKPRVPAPTSRQSQQKRSNKPSGKRRINNGSRLKRRTV